MSKQMYFGNRKRMIWVKPPSPGFTMGAVGFGEKLQYLNGGVGQRQSLNSHMEYALTWDRVTREEAQAISAYAHGIYGRDLVTWLDPSAMDKNLFNVNWSAPALGAKDAVPLAGTTRPDIVTNSDLSRGYPAEMALYTIDEDTPVRTFHLPIPAGYTAWIGAHGVASDQGLLLQPTSSGTPVGPPTSVPVLPTASNVRFSTSVDGGAGVGIDITLDNSEAGTITIAGMMAQILPTGLTPPNGDFILGLGHSGCEFDGKVSITPYFLGQADGTGESYGLAVNLVETGDWK